MVAPCPRSCLPPPPRPGGQSYPAQRTTVAPYPPLKPRPGLIYLAVKLIPGPDQRLGEDLGRPTLQAVASGEMPTVGRREF